MALETDLFGSSDEEESQPQITPLEPEMEESDIEEKDLFG